MQSSFWRAAAVLAVVGAFLVVVGGAGAATVGSPTTAGPCVGYSPDGKGGLANAAVGCWSGGWGWEPWGWSSLAVPITVGTGGTLQFDWLVQSTDSPYYDPVNLRLDGPSGTVATYASGAGSTGGWIHASTDLAAYSGQTLVLHLDVFQDGYGDQTQALINNLTLGDTTPPTIVGTPSDQVAEATGPSGAAVTYTAPTATDDTDPHPTVACAPASGSVFPIGQTTVTCTARDASGNSSSSSFTVTVRDTTPPVVTVPADQTIDATSPSGAPFTFTPRATDIVDGATAVTCTPTSGSVFAFGTTTVSCSSTDAHGNTGTASFHLTVRTAAQMLTRLAAAVDGIGPGNSLAAKLASAGSALAAGDNARTTNVLRAFRNEVAAQSGKKLTADQATSLSTAATGLIAVLGG